jgi:hypothetical protein
MPNVALVLVWRIKPSTIFLSDRGVFKTGYTEKEMMLLKSTAASQLVE